MTPLSGINRLLPVLFLLTDLRRLMMTRLIFATSAALAFLASNPQPATAYYYNGAPWCAVVSMGNGNMQWDCAYRSIEECRPNVLGGNRGWCNPNPAFVVSDSPAERRSHRKHRQHSQ